MTITLQSSAFRDGEMIPPKHTCDGNDVSPPLSWLDVPSQSESLALIFEDIDSVAGVWSHWVVYDMPSELDGLAEGIPPTDSLAVGGVHGTNGFGNLGYGGPCPSDGKTHRYVLQLYALDTELGLGPGATREQVLSRIEGHVIERVELLGRYQRLEDR